MNSNRKLMLLAGSTLLVLLAALLVGVGLVVSIFVLNELTREPRRVIRVDLVAPLALETATPLGADPGPAMDQPSTSSSLDLSATPSSAVQPASQTENQPLPLDSSTVDIETQPVSSGEVQPSFVEPMATNSPVPLDTFGNSPLPTPTTTPLLTATPSITPPPTMAPTPTPTATATVVDSSRITGRVLLEGVPIKNGVTLQLENSQTYALVAETTTGSDGYFSFENIPASVTGYNILFDQEANPQYELEQVISWGWLGPVVVSSNATINLPEFEIALQGFEPVNPEPNAAFSAEMPITFEWSAYPQASRYWVDLVRGESMEPIWKSDPLQATSITFERQAVGGELEAGEYWWGVGAQRTLGGDYMLTVYGYLPVLLVKP